jgi:hypothetical protein
MRSNRPATAAALRIIRHSAYHGVLAPHSRWRARAVAYGRDTLAAPSPEPAVACGTSHLPAPPSEPRAASGQEASGAQRHGLVVTVEGRPSEPPSSSPAPGRGPASTMSVEDPPPPLAPRTWSWADLPAPHVRGGRAGLSSVWRPHASVGHHRGPRRHPEDSHPPRAPDRGAGAPAASVRPGRLDLTRPFRRCLHAVDPAVCPQGQLSAAALLPLGAPGSTWPPPSRCPAAPPPTPGPVMRCVVTEGGGMVDAKGEYPLCAPYLLLTGRRYCLRSLCFPVWPFGCFGSRMRRA